MILKPIPLSYFFAWRASNHFNFAYGKQGSLKGNTIFSEGEKQVQIEGKKKKIEWVSEIVAQNVIQVGDFIWQAPTEETWQRVLNFPWTLHDMIEKMRTGERFHGSWKVFKARHELVPTAPPSVSLTSLTQIEEAESCRKWCLAHPDEFEVPEEVSEELPQGPDKRDRGHFSLYNRPVGRRAGAY